MTVRREQIWGAAVLILVLLLLPGISAAQKSILPKECVDCHSSEAKYPVLGARSQYLTSGHRTLGNASYANAAAVQLLMDSIKSLDKNFDDSKRPQ